MSELIKWMKSWDVIDWLIALAVFWLVATCVQSCGAEWIKEYRTTTIRQEGKR